MKAFMDDEDFLLTTQTARQLFETYAKDMPILDYHCHLSPQEIFEDKHFDTITDVWLGGDHYKWRLMRANGVEERYITGDAPAREKFQKWAETLVRCIGNPVFEWSHLELKRFFGYEGMLNPDTAEEVWQLANAKLHEPSFSARNLIKMSGVTLICTTDDPADTLEWHQKIAADPSFDVQVIPAMRPDHALNIAKPGFGAYVTKLAEVAHAGKIATFDDFKRALSSRLDFFKSMGCKASDHALDYVEFVSASDAEIETIFEKACAGEKISDFEVSQWRCALMQFLASEYVRLGWAMQLHFGCKRDNNTEMYAKLGPDTGYDSIRNGQTAQGLADFLDALHEAAALPKTILYSLDPNDSYMIDTVMQCFQEAPVAGKLQNGSAWWFNDSEDGMRAQLSALANEGVFGNFIGMLTDSRSFLSYPRHEYFRRIVCSLIGEWVEAGKYPTDEALLATLIQDISYNNAVRYFGFNLDEVK